MEKYRIPAFIIGFALIALAFWFANSTQQFLEVALITDGTVIRVDDNRRWDDEPHKFQPTLLFITDGDEQVRFVAVNSSENYNTYRKGDVLPVIYDPAEPEGAKIYTYLSTWGTTIICAVLGLFFIITTIVNIVIDSRKNALRSRLLANGRRIRAEVIEIVENTAREREEGHPVHIIAEWINPHSSNVHRYESGDIWFDPRDHIEGGRIEVVVDRVDPGRYLFALEFDAAD